MATERSGKTLVVYYSRTGNTARVARDLAKSLGADVENLQDPAHGSGFLASIKASIDSIREKPAKLGELEFDPARYALVVIGTPVWAGRMSPAIRAYLKRFAPTLRHVGLYTTSATTQASKVVLPVERLLGHRTDAFIGFTATDLADQQFYDQKLQAFLKALLSSLSVGAAA